MRRWIAAALLPGTLSLLPAARSGEIYAAHNRVMVIDSVAGRTSGEAPLDEVVNGIAFSADGRYAFVGSSGGKEPERGGGLVVLEAGSLRVLSRPLSDPVKELRVSADGKRLHLLQWRVHPPDPPEKPAAKKAEKQDSTGAPGKSPPPEKGGGRGARRRTPLKEPFRLRTLDISGDLSGRGPGTAPKDLGGVAVGLDLYDFVVSPDGKTAYLLDPGHDALRAVELPSGAPLATSSLAGGKEADGTRHDAALAKLAVARDGRRAAALIDGPARTGALIIDLDSRARREVLIPIGSNLRAGRLLADGDRLLALTIERLLLLDLKEGKVLRTIPLGETFTSLAVSHDGKEIYLGSPVALRTEGSRGRGLVEIRGAESFSILAQVSIPMTVKLLQAAPPRPTIEK